MKFWNLEHSRVLPAVCLTVADWSDAIRQSGILGTELLSNEVGVLWRRSGDETSRNFRLTADELTRPFAATFKILDKLGQGSYGSVFRASHINSGTVVAIKQVALGSDIKEIVKEISIMQQCDSKYVIKYYGSYYEKYELWVSFCIFDKKKCYKMTNLYKRMFLCILYYLIYYRYGK